MPTRLAVAPSVYGPPPCSSCPLCLRCLLRSWCLANREMNQDQGNVKPSSTSVADLKRTAKRDMCCAFQNQCPVCAHSPVLSPLHTLAVHSRRYWLAQNITRET